MSAHVARSLAKKSSPSPVPVLEADDVNHCKPPRDGFLKWQGCATVIEL
jgi:hypothetical protein